MVPSAVRGMRSAAGKSPYGTEKARRTRGAMWKRRDRLVRPARAAAGGERNGPKFMPAPNKFSPLSKRAIRGSGPQPRGSLGTFHPWKVPRPGAKYPPSFSESRDHGTGKRQTSSGAPGRRALHSAGRHMGGPYGVWGYNPTRGQAPMTPGPCMVWATNPMGPPAKPKALLGRGEAAK